VSSSATINSPLPSGGIGTGGHIYMPLSFHNLGFDFPNIELRNRTSKIMKAKN